MLIEFVSTFTPIRTAVGNLGYSNVMQSLEEDLVRWAIEGQDFIGETHAMMPQNITIKIKDNKIQKCADMKLIDCVSINGVVYDLMNKNTCSDLVTRGCPCAITTSTNTYTWDGCYLTFTGLEDGTEVLIKYMARPTDENGYPMIASCCVFAIQQYIMWQLCVRMRDNRSGSCEQRWYALCRQARPQFSDFNIQHNIERLGYYFNQKQPHGKTRKYF